MMSSARYEAGMETLRKMVSEEILSQTVEHVKKFDPDFSNMIVEFAFGDIYSRPGLDLKQRELITIASLITQGAESQLSFHIHGALKAGLTPKEIVEAVMHCVPYAGFPKALGALGVVMNIFNELGIKHR
ncbi:carboxymuconolactone decarboxylase family protein [Aneurinibacillus danicus]|uniref:4-carboxymuconolactone decarboxylase n=1 Tax=Aneurinibacillus danicus TaxID=267746 RepID=A0A511V5E3_9BACL|nr:4-carboxymuconolactone decarboxylase [Aneurinibacillus danicus]